MVKEALQFNIAVYSYLVLALFSSLGRTDFNLGLAALLAVWPSALLSTPRDKKTFLGFLLLSLAVDIVWLSINGGVAKNLRNANLGFLAGTEVFTVVVSSLNVVVKVPLSLLVWMHSTDAGYVPPAYNPPNDPQEISFNPYDDSPMPIRDPITKDDKVMLVGGDEE